MSLSAILGLLKKFGVQTILVGLLIFQYLGNNAERRESIEYNKELSNRYMSSLEERDKLRDKDKKMYVDIVTKQNRVIIETNERIGSLEKEVRENRKEVRELRYKIENYLIKGGKK